jgi:hypothetical protein
MGAHVYPPQHLVVASLGYELPRVSKAGNEEGSIQDVGYGLPRRLLLGN